MVKVVMLIMSIKYTTKINKLPKVAETVKLLNKRKVEVGALEGENAWLAGIHEYGCNITAKHSKYLTVPVNHEAVGRSARSFSDLFVFTSKSGEKFLAKNDNGRLVLYYWLTKSVKIPERSFIRAGHDKNINRVMKQTERALSLVASGDKSVDDLLDLCGEQLSSAIKKYARDLSSPPNSPFTIEQKGSSSPLVDTGNMIESITWEKK